MTYDQAVGWLFPLAPLDRLTARRLSDRCELLGPAKLGHMVRIHHEQITAARWAGGFSFDQADRAATALGMHPAELWPEWWEWCSLVDDPPQLSFAGMDDL